MNGIRESRSTSEIKKPSLRTVGLALLLVASSVIGGIAYLALAATSTGGTPGVTTLGNQERQDITAANQWVEGNIDFWLESHLYDAEVRFDAGSGPVTIPDKVDVAMSFFFAEKNAIVIDWTQDWFVTLKGNVMFYSKSSVPASGGLFQCSTPPNIVTIPKGGSSIMVPQAGSICISDVNGLSNPDPNSGWTSLMSLPLSDLNKVLPKRNEPCSTIVSGLCSSGAESQSSPATDHYFRVSFVDLFGSGGKFPQSWWPNLPAGKSLAIYFRSHLALTGIWKTAIGGPGGGSQPEFCITTGPGAIRNTNYDRCSWTTISREGAGGAQGSKNHGSVNAPSIGSKTIPLPQVVSPTGFITVCKIVTGVETDRAGAFGTLTNGWTVHVEGPFGTSLTEVTGSDGQGCSKFGPLFPGTYSVSEVIQAGYVNIGTLVVPQSSRVSGTNPDPSNPVGAILTFTQAQSAIGPTVTFVNFLPTIGLTCVCTQTITDASGHDVTSRGFAVAGDTVTFTWIVTNTGTTALNVVETHTNTGRFQGNPLFMGTLASGASHTDSRSTVITTADADGTTISDSATATGTNNFGQTVTATSNPCSVIVRRPILKLSEFGYTNIPTGPPPTQGVVTGETVYTVRFTNYGTADATLAGSLTVTVSDMTGGSFACTTFTGPEPGTSLTGCVLSFSGVSVVHSGASVTFTLTMDYVTLPTGAKVFADLAATYVPAGSSQSFIPSGVPAEIMFTIQGG